MYCPPETAIFRLMRIKLEETISMRIKQITWIINHEHFVPDTLRKQQLLLTQSTSHLFYGKLLKYILEIKLLVRGGKHENNECRSPSSRKYVFRWEKNRDLPLTYGQNNNKKRCLFPLHSSQKSVSFIGSHKDFWSVFQNETQASEKSMTKKYCISAPRYNLKPTMMLLAKCYSCLYHHNVDTLY